MSPITWSILLMTVGLLLVVVEVFIPSGGILGFLSISALAASIILAFYHRGAETGFIFLAFAAVTVPTALAIALRYWPHTRMGKRLMLGLPTEEDVTPDSPLRQRLREMVGRRGVAKSLMLPSGAIEVDGLTVDALSEGMPIEAGQHVVVIKVRGNRVVVRPSDGEPEAAPSRDDILSQPIDSLGIGPFDEPLG